MKVDFHTHTLYSPDGLASLEELLAACQRVGLDRVVVTDHNTIEGAVRAQQMAPERVIVGEEILVRGGGEILAAFVTEEVPKGLPAMEAIARLRHQGAFISISHPFDVLRGGHWPADELNAILPHIDALETFNARCLWPGFNRKAQAFAHEHGLPGTVGSDAHMASEIGHASLQVPDFWDADSLRKVIGQGQRLGGLAAPWVHLGSSVAKWRKR